MALVTVTISDVITKGAKPYYFLCSISVPIGFSDSDAYNLFEGLLDACAQYKIEYMGGDLGNSQELVISGIVVGYAKKKNLLKRSNVKSNDLICSTGTFGYTGLGYSIYLDNKNFKIPERVLKIINNKLLHPQARIEWLTLLQKFANATIDSSDGLAKSLEHLARESGKLLVIETLPAFSELEKIISKDSDDYLKAVLYAGEEFEIIFSISEENYALLLQDLVNTDISNPLILGKASQSAAKESSKVLYKGKSIPKLQTWDSFNGFQ